MMLAGTTSKWVGKGSRPRPIAASQISCMAFSISCVLVGVIMVSSSNAGGGPLARGHVRLCGAIFGEEAFQGRIDILFRPDGDADELGCGDLGEGRHQRAGGPAAVGLFLDLSVAEEVGVGDDALDEIDAQAVVFGPPVIAVAEMKRVDIPPARLEALLDQVEAELIGRGYPGPSALAEVEEGLLVHLLGLGVMGDE